jgi:hypothetical protein
MGYACPVCSDPQADGEHLANHLAFTAMLGDDDHESWLDSHVSDWGEMDPETLAGHVTDHADEEEFPQLFEDTTDGHEHDHGHAQQEHSHSHGQGGSAGQPPVAEMPDAEDLGPEAQKALAEAREMTRQRRENADAANGEDGEADEAASEDGADADGADESGGS